MSGGRSGTRRRQAGRRKGRERPRRLLYIQIWEHGKTLKEDQIAAEGNKGRSKRIARTDGLEITSASAAAGLVRSEDLCACETGREPHPGFL